MIRFKFWYPGEEQDAWEESFDSEEDASEARYDADRDGALSEIVEGEG